jgi:hypothetical protein
LPFTRIKHQNVIMPFLQRLAAALTSWALLSSVATVPAQQLTPHSIQLAGGKTLELSLPANFTIDVAAQGLHRVRFMAESPDNRIFVTDMHDLSDNTLGAVSQAPAQPQ